MLAQIQKESPEDIRVVFRYFPLMSIHDKAGLAVQAAQAAGAQGKFWEMHDLLFAKQSEWQGMTVDQFKDWVTTQAADLGLDTKQFSTNLVSQANVDIAEAAWNKGVAIGLPGTPFLLINDQIWPNNLPMSQSNIEAIIKLDLLEKKQFTSCPPMTIDPLKQYVATLHTEKGDIQIELYADKAPLAVNNFIFLAKNGWYDNVTFHRVLPGYVAQAGDPSGTGYGGPGYAFSNEISPDLKFDKAGVVAMANAGPDTNGSQFFITYAPAPQLDGDYTIFGQVISGMDVAESLTARDPSTSQDLAPGDKILSVTIQEK